MPGQTHPMLSSQEGARVVVHLIGVPGSTLGSGVFGSRVKSLNNWWMTWSFPQHLATAGAILLRQAGHYRFCIFPDLPTHKLLRQASGG
jgi:hypothetical protein